MIGDLARIRDAVASAAASLGFASVEDEDWLACFRRGDAWMLELSGDAASYPAFGLNIVSPSGKRYALWLLMRAFDDATPDERKRPSLDNQLWFLTAFNDELFSEPASYREDYTRLDAPLPPLT